MESNKQIFDGIFSLGAWCQVGSACRQRDFNVLSSPFHNFGVKRWQNVYEILESRFKDYWELENMTIGKLAENYSTMYREKRMIYKVYCNKHYMVSNHHFDREDNKSTKLLTYEAFKEKIDVLTEVFLAQCDQYETALFVCKVLSFPKRTEISKEDILKFSEVLDKLRGGKPYQLRLAVPARFYKKVLKWVEEENLTQVRIYPWRIAFNDDAFHEEWNTMLNDVALADNHIERLNYEIFGITDPYSPHIDYLNS